MTKICMAVVAALSFHAHAGTLSDALKDYGVKVDDSASFKVLKDQKLAGSTKMQHLIEAETAKRERLEIKIIQPLDSQVAHSTIETERTALKKLYAAAQTPYMGDIAQALGGCPAQMGPMQTDITLLKNKVEAVLGAVTENLAFGACSKEQAKFRGAYMAYYDAASKTLWSWRVFAPWKDDKKPLNSDWLKPILNKFSI